MTIRRHHHTGLVTFVRDCKANGFNNEDISIRGRRTADHLCVRELRTKKHDHEAVAFDELGNATVLTAQGQVKQLIGDETKSLPR